MTKLRIGIDMGSSFSKQPLTSEMILRELAEAAKLFPEVETWVLDLATPFRLEFIPAE